MKPIVGFCTAIIIVVTGLHHVWGQEQGKPAAKPATAGKAAETKTAAEDKPAAAAKTEKSAGESQPSVPPKPAPEIAAMEELATNLAQAFNKHEAKSFASLFSADGEYVDEAGIVVHGRAAIEEDFTGVFKTNPESSIKLAVTSTRRVAPSVVAVDGRSEFTKAKGALAVKGHFSFFATKEGEKWLMASLRELSDGDPKTHREQVKQLEWLVGEWIDEGADSHVHFSCRWDDGGNFLIRDFEVHFAGQPTMKGTQRIGYDPLTGKLKSWVFDSAGGYSDGFFHREGKSWTLHASGATAEGQMASGANVFTRIDDHRMLWGAVDRVVGGEQISDMPVVTIVKKPPPPKPMPQR